MRQASKRSDFSDCCGSTAPQTEPSPGLPGQRGWADVSSNSSMISMQSCSHMYPTCHSPVLTERQWSSLTVGHAKPPICIGSTAPLLCKEKLQNPLQWKPPTSKHKDMCLTSYCGAVLSNTHPTSNSAQPRARKTFLQLFHVCKYQHSYL